MAKLPPWLGSGQIPAVILIILAGFFKFPHEYFGFFLGSKSDPGAVTRVAIVFDVEAQALPFVSSLNTAQPSLLDPQLPAAVYRSRYNGIDVAVAISNVKASSTGLVNATLATESLLKLMGTTDLVIAPGFVTSGVEGGSVLASSVRWGNFGALMSSTGWKQGELSSDLPVSSGGHLMAGVVADVAQLHGNLPVISVQVLEREGAAEALADAVKAAIDFAIKPPPVQQDA